ncbi:MAG: CaiB/BaiF CoA transferase family protein [Candidatus Binataceae bacterium]
MAKALDGVTVIELGSNLPAAYATMLLAEQGADAIRIEPSGGDGGRGNPQFHVLNRSKRAVALDLTAPASIVTLHRLIRLADIFVAGAPRAQLARFGLDDGSIFAVNPGLIRLYLPPFGSRGRLADIDGSEELAAAVSGITGSQWARSGDPVAPIFPAVSYSTALLGAIAASAAVFARRSGMAGQTVEVPMIAGGLALQTGTVLRHPAMRALHPTEGSQNPLGPIPCYRLFEAADGLYLFIACGNPIFWNRLTIAAGRPELVADPRFEHAPWGISPEDREPLAGILEPIIRTRSREEWMRILGEADVPCAPAISRHEFFDTPQVRYLDMHREIEDPALGATAQMGVPIRLSATPGDIAGPAPALDGQSLAALTDELEKHAPRPSEFRPINADSPRPAPLDGVTVLDFSSYIAGSFCGMLLAQLGADVIKIESLPGDSFRSMEFAFMGWNQGKRSLTLDLSKPDGRQLAAKLAERADIVLENMRAGRMHRFGLDYQTLSAKNSRLIYMTVTGYGSRGPNHLMPGFDPLLQAQSGMMAAQGGHQAHPVYLTCSPCDYGAAMLATFGCVLALRARERSGRGQFCETSLLQAAMAFQAGEFIFYDGRPDLENGSPELRGSSALRRVYRCRDGRWLCLVAANSDQWERLRDILGIEPDLSFDAARGEPPEGNLAGRIAGLIADYDRDGLIERLFAAGVAAGPVNRVADLFGDEQMLASDLLIDVPHPKWGSVTQTGLLMEFSATAGVLKRSAPMLGEHTDEILRAFLGCSPDDIRDLRARRIVGNSP